MNRRTRNWVLGWIASIVVVAFFEPRAAVAVFGVGCAVGLYVFAPFDIDG